MPGTKTIDYSTGGMLMPGRQYNSGDYRYGFNGKEMDNEAKGTGNSLDFGARILDPRLGRWMSVDPQASRYPFYSPYVAFGNNPIVYIDPGGETLKVAGSESAKAKFKACLEKQFAGKVSLQYGDFGILHGSVNEGATLTKSEAALFNQVMYKGITNIGVISGNDRLEVSGDGGSIDVNSTGNVMIGAAYRDMQVLDLDDIEMFDQIGRTEEGLGPTTAGALVHEIAEANKYQSEGEDLADYYQGSWDMAWQKSHEYGTGIQNEVDGSTREVDYNFTEKHVTQRVTSGGETTEFGRVSMKYRDSKGAARSVDYKMNNTNIAKEKPTSKPIEEKRQSN